MQETYTVLPSQPLMGNAQFVKPAAQPPLVRLNDPATYVMTDFRNVPVVTIDPATDIEFALAKMKYVGIRMLLVVNQQAQVVGLVTARDLLGEKPVRVAEAQKLAHHDITVEMVMTPQAQITVIDLLTVEKASVGHIVATLDKFGRQHGLVVETDADSGLQTIRGMFSTTQIARQLGKSIQQGVNPAHSLADLLKQSA